MTQQAITTCLVDESSSIYNPHLSDVIEIRNVVMDFNSASQQLNSFKEYFIALAKRELMFKRFRALDDISLTVQKGDVFGILGTNGSGKSTLMKIVSGVLEPTEGSVAIRGNIAPLIELGAGFDFELTARENIYLNGALLGYSKSFIDQHFEEIVDFAEIRDFLDMPLKNYSSGMVSRIAFAIATVIVPDILIVDEVLSVGDFMFRQKCEKRIQSLIHEHGTTVLIVSHSSEQIERLCNKAIWIEKGHMRMIGPAKEVSKVYQALGGHKGSQKSESTLFELLQDRGHGRADLIETIAGADMCSTNAIVAKQLLDEASTSSFVLCPGDDPSVYLASLALGHATGSVNLMTQAERLPESSLSILLGKTPDNVYCIAAAAQSEQLVGSVRSALPRECSLRVFPYESPDSLTLEIFEMASATHNDSPAPRIAIAAGSNLGSASATLAPLVACGVPFFIVTESETADRVMSHLENTGIRVLLVLNNATNEALDDLARRAASANLETVVLDDIKGDAANEEALHLLSSLFGYEPNLESLYLSAQDGVIDALSAAPLVARDQSIMLTVDHNNMDSMVRAIEQISSSEPNLRHLVFLGGNYCFNPVDKEIFGKAAALDEIAVPESD